MKWRVGLTLLYFAAEAAMSVGMWYLLRNATVPVWRVLLAIAVIIVFAGSAEKNPIGGAATIGFFVGLVIAIFSGWSWWTVGKAVTVATFTAVVFELAHCATARNLSSSQPRQ